MPGIRPDVDPDGLLEYSVVFTDRSLNHMSQSFQGVMRDISDTLKFFSLFVGDFLTKGFFQGHHQLHCVERIGTEVLNEFGLWGHLVCVDAELFDDDVHHTLFD